MKVLAMVLLGFSLVFGAVDINNASPKELVLCMVLVRNKRKRLWHTEMQIVLKILVN